MAIDYYCSQNINGTLTTSGNITSGGSVYLPDNAKLIFGGAPDFEMYHNSTTNQNFINSLLGRQLVLSSDAIHFQNPDLDEYLASFIADGAVTLYYNASSKFATSNTGATVTGDLLVSNGTISTINSIGSLYIDVNTNDDYSGSRNFRVSNNGTTQFNIDSSNKAVFYGDVSIPAGGKYYTYTGSDNYITYNSWYIWTGSDIIIRNSSTGPFKFQTNGANDVLTLDSSQEATFHGDILTNTDSSSDIGKTGTRWANLWVDSINGATPAVGADYLPLAGGTMTGDVIYNDSVKIKLGTGGGNSDIYHNGTDMYIRQLTTAGDLSFAADSTGSGGASTAYFWLDGGVVKTRVAKDINFEDDVKASFGLVTDPDLQIYHKSSNDRSYIYNQTGDLYIENDADDARIRFICDNGSGGTQSYFDLAGSFADGTRVFTVWGDNSVIALGSALDCQIYHNGTNTLIYNQTGDLKVGVTGTFAIQNNSWDENIATFTKDGDVQLFYDSSKKFQTTNTGVTITGALGVTNINMTGILDIQATYPRINLTDTNHDDDWSIINDDGNFLIYNVTDGGQPIKIDTSNNTTLGAALNIPSYIYHSSDTNTYFGFDTDDSYVIVTGGSERLGVNNSGLKLGNSGAIVTTILDEDAMGSNSATALATQQSIKAYVDTKTTGVLAYQETWNANTNSPTLSSGSGTPGYYYIVSVAGSTNLDGITDWAVGDWAVFSDLATDAWQKIDNTAVGNVSGSGTIERLAKWSGSGTIANSTISDDGSTVTFNSDVVFNSTHDVMWDASENRLEFWDNAHLSFGDPGGTPDLLIYHDGSNSYIKEQGTGSLKVGAANFHLMNAACNEYALTATPDGPVIMYYDAAVRTSTIATGSNIKFDGGGAAIELNIHNEGTAAGDDAKIAFETQAAMDWAIGIDRSDSNSFKISRHQNLGTNDVFSLTTNDATFAGDVTIDNGTSSTLIIEKDATGGGKIQFNDAGSQEAYISLDAAEDMTFYAASGNDQAFYAGGVLNETKSGATSTFAGNVTMTSAGSPTLTITDTSQTTTLKAFAQDSNAHIGTWSNHPFIIDSNSTTALTIDTSQNATFAGGIKVNGPGSYNTIKSTNEYTLGLIDSNSVTQWWLKTYTNGGFALHENGVGDQFTIAAGGAATFAGSVTGTSAVFNGGVTIDGIYIDGTEIDLSSGTLTFDADAYSFLDGDATFAGGISMTDSILIDYTGSDGQNNDAGLKIMNDASDWGAYIRKDSDADYGLRIDSGGANAFNIYSTTGGSTKTFGVNGGTGAVTIGDVINMPNNKGVTWTGGSVRVESSILKLVGDSGIQLQDNTTITGGNLSITGDGSNAATLTETGAGLLTIAAVDDVVIDSGSDITLDAAGNDIRFFKNGVEFGKIKNESGNLTLFSSIENEDIIFKGNDGGSTITALTLDMSSAGHATFNSGITAKTATAGDYGLTLNTSNGDNMKLSVADTGTAGAAHGTLSVSDGNLIVDASGDIALDADGGDIYLKDGGTEFGRLSNSSTDLVVYGSVDDLVLKAEDDVYIQTAGGEDSIIAAGNGGVRLFYDTSEKLETVPASITNLSGGIEVTSTISGDDLTIELDHDTDLRSGIILNIGQGSYTSGKVYANDGGTWNLADADDVHTTYMVGLCIGVAFNEYRLLLNGIYDTGGHHGFTIGAPLYISGTAGDLTTTAPSGSNDYVRVVGYALSTSNIYFCPDNTWVKID